MSERNSRDYPYIPPVEGTSALKEDLYEMAVEDLGTVGVGEAVVLDFPTIKSPEIPFVPFAKLSPEAQKKRLSELPPGAEGRIIWVPEDAQPAKKYWAAIQRGLASGAMSTGSGRGTMYNQVALQAPYTHGQQR